MKVICTISILALMFNAIVAQGFNKEVYLTHVYKDGEKIKDIAELYKITPKDLLDINKNILVNGVKPGMEIRIPFYSIFIIKATYKGEDYRVYWKESEGLVSGDVSNIVTIREEDFFNIQNINNTISNIANGRSLDQVVITFNDSETLLIYDQKEIQNLMKSLLRVYFVRNNLNMVLNRT